MGLQYAIQYKKGINNVAADSLSRRPPHSSHLLTISVVQPAWIALVAASYVDDDQVQCLLQQLALNPRSSDTYTLNKGILRYKGHISVGGDFSLQTRIISAFHDSPLGGHSCFPVTYRRLVCLFSWSGMKTMVREYVRCYHTCQQAKPERLPPAGLLQPLLVPSGPWEVATMDFIDGLPVSGQYNFLLVIVDKFSKYSHFVPLRHPYTASKVVELFVNSIYCLHGMPHALVSDRDPIFTNQFWQVVFRATGTELQLSTTHHPETDGQTERVN
jgi:hypothetical protein